MCNVWVAFTVSMPFKQNRRHNAHFQKRIVSFDGLHTNIKVKHISAKISNRLLINENLIFIKEEIRI